MQDEMMSDDGDDNSLYSTRQQFILAFLSYFSAPLSAVGSAVIIYVIVRDARRHTSPIQTYQRLMLGMSVLDVISSVGITVFGHWSMPAGTPYVFGARGNQATCTANFYFINCLFSSTWYTVFLVVYLMLLVRFNWPRKRFARWVEPWVHFAALGTALIAPVHATFENSIHPMYVLPGFCWTLNYPVGCEPGEDPVCTNGRVPGTINGVYIIFLFGVMIICLALLVSHLRKTDEYLQRHAVSGEDRSPLKNKEIAKEALLFIGAVLLVYVPNLPFFFVDTKPESTSRNRAILFTFAVLTKLLTPLQGILNSYIFLRGKLLALDHQGQGHMSLGMFVAYLHETTAPSGAADPGNMLPCGNDTASPPVQQGDPVASSDCIESQGGKTQKGAS